MTNSEPHPQTGQPVGLPVDATPAQRPGPVTLKGRYGRVEKLEPRSTRRIWGRCSAATMKSGPILPRRAVFDGGGLRRLYRQARSGSRPLRLCSHRPRPDIRSAISRSWKSGRRMRVIEVGHVALFAGLATDAAGHRGAIFAGALCLRDAWLPPLRMEM